MKQEVETSITEATGLLNQRTTERTGEEEKEEEEKNAKEPQLEPEPTIESNKHIEIDTEIGLNKKPKDSSEQEGESDPTTNPDQTEAATTAPS